MIFITKQLHMELNVTVNQLLEINTKKDIMQPLLLIQTGIILKQSILQIEYELFFNRFFAHTVYNTYKIAF